MTIKNFLNLLNSDKYIETIYLNGNCYKLYLLLNKLFPGSKPYINKEKNHIVTKFKNKFYDITGEVNGEFHELNKNDLENVIKWSFYKNNCLSIMECPFCEEQILI